MPDEDKKAEDAPVKKGLPLKMLIIVGIVIITQGAIIGGSILIFGESPPSVEAQGLVDDPKAAELQLTEVLLVGGKFQNTRQGAQAYLYDATIYIVVQRRHEGVVQSDIESNNARISQEVTEIFARAEPAQLNEPDRLTLKRQLLDKCKKRFGDDADGEPYVKDVVISNWKRFSTDL